MVIGALIIAFLAGAGGATVARLLAVEHGPLFVLNDLRAAAVEVVEDAITEKNSALLNKALHSLKILLTCPICQSTWLAPALAALIGAMAGAGWQWVAIAALASPSVAWAIGNAGGWIGRNEDADTES